MLLNPKGLISPSLFDPILREFEDQIDSFTYLSLQADRLSKAEVTEITVSDRGKVLKFKTDINGVLPNVFDSLVKDFLIIGSQNTTTGVKLGE